MPAFVTWSLLVDAVLVALLVIFILVGRHRGFIKTMAGVVSFVAALVLASMLAGPIADFLYDKAVAPGVTDAVSASLAEDGPAAQRLDRSLEEMPGFVTRLLAGADIHTGADLLRYVDPAADLAENVSERVVRPVVAPILQTVCSLLLFVILLVVVNLLLRVLNVLAKLPGIKQVNQGMGLLAGLMEGVLWVLFAVAILDLVAAFGWIDGVDATLLEGTYLFRWVAHINPFTGFVREVMLPIA